ncbi:MAG: hypothetical protein SGJ02_10665 [bacterium]|nr:hypothetical protein [bacterium]
MIKAKLISIDPSLTCSGWAVFSIESGALCGVGKVRSLPASIPLSNRLKDLQNKISDIFKIAKLTRNDVLICEAQTSMKDPRGAFKVEQVRSIFEALAREKEILVPGRISPRTIQSEILGFKGAQQKREEVKSVARSIVKSMFNKELSKLGFNVEENNLLKNQDIVDAILVGVMGLTRIKTAKMSNQSLAITFSEGSSKRRSSRAAWGKGEDNSFGWTEVELNKLLSKI